MLVLFVALLLGLAAGLYAGWVIKPMPRGGAQPSALREDYQTDYVLMVAEAFYAEPDAELAARRLAPLGDTPVRQVQEAIITAGELNYPRADLERLAALSQALQLWNPAQMTEQP